MTGSWNSENQGLFTPLATAGRERALRCLRRNLLSCSHIFCECTLAPTVWAWVFSLVNQLYSSPLGFSPPLVIFKHGLPSGSQHTHSKALSSFLFNLTLNELWAARNLYTFEGRASSAQNVVNRIKHGVRQRLYAAFNLTSTSDFVKTCGHKQLLCRVDNKTLSVLIWHFTARPVAD